MRTTDTMSFSLKKIVAEGKAQSVGREEWLHAVAEIYDEDKLRSVVATSSLLEHLGTVAVPKTKQFVARNHFAVNTKATAPTKISYLGDNFKAWFLGETEEPSDETTLRYQNLREASVDGPIIAELGGEAKAETTLAQIYALMKGQKNGETGVPLNNGYANIFYVCDVGSVLRAVSVGWVGVGWGVSARSVENPGGWGGGGRVFSRDS